LYQQPIRGYQTRDSKTKRSHNGYLSHNLREHGSERLQVLSISFIRNASNGTISPGSRDGQINAGGGSWRSEKTLHKYYRDVRSQQFHICNRAGSIGEAPKTRKKKETTKPQIKVTAQKLMNFAMGGMVPQRSAFPGPILL
jgi:hypothetical protein